MVRIDTEDTPEGSKDLWAVTQAVKVPVLARDWCIHPLQVVESKEAGAAGLIGVIAQVHGRARACSGPRGGPSLATGDAPRSARPTGPARKGRLALCCALRVQTPRLCFPPPQVNGRGTAVMSSFSAALGLDAPVEIVNSRVGGGLGGRRGVAAQHVGGWSPEACRQPIPALLQVACRRAPPPMNGLQTNRPHTDDAPANQPTNQPTNHPPQELEGLSRMGVVFYGINIGVGISVSLPGFASDLAHGLLGEMPFGAITLVGAKGLEDARKARLSGADAVLIKKEMWEGAEAEGRSLETLVEQVKYLTGGDD